jgi:hypothetical protein
MIKIDSVIFKFQGATVRALGTLENRNPSCMEFHIASPGCGLAVDHGNAAMFGAFSGTL